MIKALDGLIKKFIDLESKVVTLICCSLSIAKRNDICFESKFLFLQIKWKKKQILSPSLTFELSPRSEELILIFDKVMSPLPFLSDHVTECPSLQTGFELSRYELTISLVFPKF